jgi:hypothetical protein
MPDQRREGKKGERHCLFACSAKGEGRGYFANLKIALILFAFPKEHLLVQ